MRNKHFRRGQGAYTCQSCGKLTRDTEGEGGCRLCLDCFNLAGIENSISDNGAEEAMQSYGAEARAILARRPELADKFPTIREAIK